MENGFYWVKYNCEWTIAMKGDEGWYLHGCEYTMEEAGYGELEEIGERIVREGKPSHESSKSLSDFEKWLTENYYDSMWTEHLIKEFTK